MYTGQKICTCDECKVHIYRGKKIMFFKVYIFAFSQNIGFEKCLLMYPAEKL